MQGPFTSSSAFGSSRPGDVTNDPRFNHSSYTIKRKMLQAFGGTFYLYDPSGNLVLWGTQKAFKLKQDLRLYADENQSQEILRVAARSIVGFSISYDVYDSRTNEKVGAFKREGLKSAFMRDTWVLMNTNDTDIGLLQEDSMALALIRRFVDFATLLLPQKYTFTIGGQAVAHYQRSKNPFASGIAIQFEQSGSHLLDKRLALAMAMLLEAIEGKQR